MKKRLFCITLLLVVCCATGFADNEKSSQNVLENIPFKDEGFGRKKLVDEDYFFMMQVALKPGQSVPQHKANSHVHILVLMGEIVVNLDGKDVLIKEGDLLPVAFETPMNLKNVSKENASFLVIKTPHPSAMK